MVMYRPRKFSWKHYDELPAILIIIFILLIITFIPCELLTSYRVYDAGNKEIYKGVYKEEFEELKKIQEQPITDDIEKILKKEK